MAKNDAGDIAPQAPPVALQSVLHDWAIDNAYGKDSTATGRTADHNMTGKSSPIEKTEHTSPAAEKILGNFGIDDAAAKVSKIDLKNLDSKETEQFLAVAHSQSFVSADAALVSVAHTLAANPELVKKLIDTSGKISRDGVDQLRMADQGSRETGHKGAPILGKDERDNLNFIASHQSVFGEKGLPADVLSKQTQEQLLKILSKNGMTAGQAVKEVAAQIRQNASDTTTTEHVRNYDQAQISPDAFPSVAKRVLAKIDSGHTGEVTKAQLAKALQDPRFKGEEAQALAALYSNFDRLHNLSKHEGFFSHDTITAGDLDKYNQLAQQRKIERNDGANMTEWAQGNLKRFTQPGSDHLTSNDINKALSNNHISAYDRQMLTTIQKHYGEMGSYYRQGVSADDISTYNQNLDKDETQKMISGVFSSCYTVAGDAQRRGTSYDLYEHHDPKLSIVPDAVKQGAIGDCYYEAVVASLAKTNPTLIRDSIKDNHDGTYTVTFPGAKNEPITVKAPTEAELGIYNRGTKYGVWASVLEKAFGQYRDNHAWFAAATPQEGADGGGRPEPVIKLLTGRDSDNVTVAGGDKADVARRLTEAFAAHPPRTVVSGILSDAPWKKWFGTETDVTADKFYKSHEYSVTGFIPDGKGGGTVEIRNPWGLEDGTVDGTIRISLDEYMKNFTDLSVQK